MILNKLKIYLNTCDYFSENGTEPEYYSPHGCLEVEIVPKLELKLRFMSTPAMPAWQLKLFLFMFFLIYLLEPDLTYYSYPSALTKG